MEIKWKFKQGHCLACLSYADDVISAHTLPEDDHVVFGLCITRNFTDEWINQIILQP